MRNLQLFIYNISRTHKRSNEEDFPLKRKDWIIK